jgi:hypothetical protein
LEGKKKKLQGKLRRENKKFRSLPTQTIFYLENKTLNKKQNNEEREERRSDFRKLVKIYSSLYVKTIQKVKFSRTEGTHHFSSHNRFVQHLSPGVIEVYNGQEYTMHEPHVTLLFLQSTTFITFSLTSRNMLYLCKPF